MKEFAGMTVNVHKTIKAGEDDTNEEGIYAELNILVSETKYEISNARDVVRTRHVDEIELMVTAEGARRMAKSLEDVADRMDEAAEKEKEKDAAYADWIKEN
jgi:hypothetical protein